MGIKVVDASVVIALLFREPQWEALATYLRGDTLVAPVLLGFELTNACLNKMRRHQDQRANLLRAFLSRGGMGIEEEPVDLNGVLSLAITTGLTAYDASYLWLANGLGAELVTLDKKLHAAATLSGTPVAVIPPSIH